MKDYIKQIIDKNAATQVNINRIREYIQENFLYIVYKKKIYADMVFCGGTALRFLYKIKRFSEDLDFSLSQNAKKFDFVSSLNIIKREFIASGYNVEIKYSVSSNVNNAFIQFPGLLFEFGLSAHKEEKLSIKYEIDTNPPAGGKEELSVLNGVFMFNTQHYDIASLFAGKIHALLERKYTKGRDWYDLLWYRTKFEQLQPNFILLNSALKQTDAGHININEGNWKESVMDVASVLDIEKVKADISRFLENPEEVELITRKTLLQILEK
jgi:predicted nucleotidyltransferase component of viral defense system